MHHLTCVWKMYTPETNSRPSLKLRGHRGVGVSIKQAREPEEDDDVFVFDQKNTSSDPEPSLVNSSYCFFFHLCCNLMPSLIFCNTVNTGTVSYCGSRHTSTFAHAHMGAQHPCLCDRSMHGYIPRLSAGVTRQILSALTCSVCGECRPRLQVDSARIV